MLQRLKKALATRLWSALQYPEPELLHERGGIGDVVRFLKGCASAKRSRETLARFGARIDPETPEIAPCVTIHPPRPERGVEGFAHLTVGARVHIGWDVLLDLSDRVTIEDDVHLGMRAIVLTHFYIGEASPGKPLAGYFPAREAPVVLKRGCAVGAGCIVLPGVTVGEDAIVGAGVVVKADVPPRSVIEPAPARTLYELPDPARRAAQ